MNLFDILGPIMVGPSSSHTAGAVRIGNLASKLLQDKPVRADIILHGSFATTGVGHGTDRALIAGLLGMQPDDMRIPDSFLLAQEAGLEYSFTNKTIKDAHPNTAVLSLQGANGRTIEVQAASIGGGRVEIHKLDGIEVVFSAEKPTLIVYNQDKPGTVTEVSSVLTLSRINIATMHLFRDKKGGFAVMVIEMDQGMPVYAVQILDGLEGIHKVIYLDPEN